MPSKKRTKSWIHAILACLVVSSSPARSARPRFDTSTDMGLVLVPADAEIDSVIFRLRATDQDADFPLLFDITATVTPIVRIENLPCTLYNKVCQANVILTKRLVPGRLHDFAVRVKDSKGDSNSMQATISVTNATTQRDKIFPHIPAIIMVPEDSKPGKELDYILVRSNQWSGKPVYIELWQPKELFTIRQRQTPAETRGVITLMGELDFETQSMYTLKMYATDPYTEPRKDTRNIAGLHLVVIVQDVQDVPPIFTLAPPLTKIDNTVQPGDIILRVHAEDGDKGVPRQVTYGLVSEGNPFTPFFNISETTGEITLARPLEELTLITHVGAPVVLKIVAEEIRRSTEEPAAQATVVEVGLLLGEPGNSPPFFENDNYVAWMEENSEPGSPVNFTEHYSTRVRDEDIGKAGVFALKLFNNNGTFEINPTVAERVANFVITIRDNSLIDYETHKSLRFEINAQEVGPATNLSATVPCTVFIRDVNDNAPEFDLPKYEATVSENAPAGTRILQVRATDKDTGSFGRIQYTRITGPGSEGFEIDPNTGIITVPMGKVALDRETAASLRLSVEARDEDGKGLRGVVPLVVNLLDVNDNPPVFEKQSYEFTLNDDSTNFTVPAIIKAVDGDAEPPNNEVRYELVHGNYDNKFHLNEITGELYLREPINRVRRTRQNPYEKFATKIRKGFKEVRRILEDATPSPEAEPGVTSPSESSTTGSRDEARNLTSRGNDGETPSVRRKRENDDVLFTLTARAYDLGVPHLSGETRIRVMKPPVAGARIVSFVVPGDNPDPAKTAETLTAITGGRVTVQEIRPYTAKDAPNVPGSNASGFDGEKKSIVVARVEPNGSGTSLVDIERIQAALVANGVGVIGGVMPGMETGSESNSNGGSSASRNTNLTTVYSEEVTVYKAENRLLFWLLIILGLLMLLALIALIVCCICPGCPFYMAPRKRRVHSSETLMARSEERPRGHFHRKHARLLEASWPERKHAWSADPMRRNWRFNRRNQKAAGLASLPGDVRVMEREREPLEKPVAYHARNGPASLYSMTHQARRPAEEERIYIEDVEGTRAREYASDFLRQQDQNRAEIPQHLCPDRDDHRPGEQSRFVREQHFYRDGNAEILRLVTRGQAEEEMEANRSSMRPQTLVIEQTPLEAYRNDGKEILLRRFIEDQKNRHGINVQDPQDGFQDVERRSMESHQRQKEMVKIQAAAAAAGQQTIVLLPERLEEDHRRHIEELGPEVQRLIIDHGFCDAKFEGKNGRTFVENHSSTIVPEVTKTSTERPKEQSLNPQHLSLRDSELARQNILLTRLLLEKDGREQLLGGVGALADSASYLETQSLPGQVATATQTDRTAATQTELPSRSRSDNEESEEDAKIRKKMRSKKRYGETEPRRGVKTLWVKAPIEEEEMRYGTEKKTIFLRKKTRDVRDPRRISLEKEVLREISDSLEENADSPADLGRNPKKEESIDKEESPSDGDDKKLRRSSPMEMAPRDGRKRMTEKRESTSTADDDEARRETRSGKHDDLPSFRILEKEMNSLSKKLSKLAGRKMLRYGSETDSHETVKAKAAPMDRKKTMKKVQVVEMKNASESAEVKTKRSKSTSRTVVSGTPVTGRTKIHEGDVDDEKEPKVATNRRKAPFVSTGSSEVEEIGEKTKRSIPTVSHAKKHGRMIVKHPPVKPKKRGAMDCKDASSLAAGTHDSGEGRDTSDTTSKGSIKPWESEREARNAKRYNTGMVDGQSGLASGSASSDSSRDKKRRETEGRVIDVGAEKKSEETSPVPNADDTTDETTVQKEEIPDVDGKCTVEINAGVSAERSEERLMLDEKDDVESSDRKSDAENMKDKKPRIEDKIAVDAEMGVESSEDKKKREATSEQEGKEIPILDKTCVIYRVNEKKASVVNDEDRNTEKAGEKQRQIGKKVTPDETSDAESRKSEKKNEPIAKKQKEIALLDETPADDHTEARTASQLNNQDSNTEISEDKNSQIGERIAADAVSDAERSKGGAKLELILKPQGEEKPGLDQPSDIDHTEPEMAFKLKDKDSTAEILENEKPRDGGKFPPDKKTAADHIEKNAASERNDDDPKKENSRDEEPQIGDRILGISDENIEQNKEIQSRKSPTLETGNNVEKAGPGRMVPGRVGDNENLENLEKAPSEKKDTIVRAEAKSTPADDREKKYESPSVSRSDNFQDNPIQKSKKSALKTDTSGDPGEASCRAKQEISIDSATVIKPIEESFINESEAEIGTKSHGGSESVSNEGLVVPAEMPKSKSTMENLEETFDDAIRQHDHENSRSQALGTIPNEIPTMTKEEIIDFVDREIKDSLRSLQGHYHPSSDKGEKIKDSIVDRATVGNAEEESAPVSKKEGISEASAFESIEDGKRRRFKDGQAFSDDFDHFRESEENIDVPYQRLRSQSWDEKIPDDNTASAKNENEPDDEESSRTEPEEKPRSAAEEKTLEGRNSTANSFGPSEIQIAAGSPTESGPTGFDSSTSAPSEPKPPETKAEEPIDVSGNTAGPAESSEVGPLREEHRAAPTIPPLNIQLSEEQTGAMQDSRETSPATISPKSSTPADLVLAASPREYGIADSFFLDAKVLTAPSSPKDDENKTKTASMKDPRKDEMKIIDIPPIDLSRDLSDDEDDSDSSEASGKTTLTARPYGTPRRPMAPSADGEAAKEAEGTSASVLDPRKTGETSFDDPAKETLTRNGSQTDINEDPSGKIVDVTGGGKTKPEVEVSPARVPREVLKEKSGVPPLSEDEKPEKDAHRVDKMEETTEKVQLSEIRQKPLPPHPDGLVSLPETSISVKNFDDPPEETQFSRETETTGDVENLVREITSEDRSIPPSRPDDLETKLGDKIRKLASRETKELAAKSLLESTESIENRDEGRAKVVPRPKVVKGVARKKVTPSEKLTKNSGNAIKSSTKSDFPKKDDKIKTLRSEPTRSSNQATAKRPRDPRAKDEPDVLSRAGRFQREKKTTTHPGTDAPEKTLAQLRKARKVSKNVGDSVGKKATEINVTREGIKASESRQMRVKIDKIEEGRNIDRQKAPKDANSKKQDPKASENLQAPSEITRITPVRETEKPKLEDDEKTAERETSTDAPKPFSERTEISGETLSSEKLKIEAEIPPFVDNEKEKSTVSSEPSTKSENPATSEMNRMEMAMPNKQVESEDTNVPEEAKTEARSEKIEEQSRVSTEEESSKIAAEKSASPRKTGKSKKEAETIESQSRYMEWYKLKREEMERKRRERKDGDAEEARPKWLRKRTRQRWIKVGPEERRIFDPKMPGETTPSRRRKIKPRVNVESEQLRAIVRQGRKLRKAQGGLGDDPQIEIFATEKPPLCSIQSNSRSHHQHHLVQHSEYKYEKMPPTSFHLHPQSVINSPHPTSLQNFDDLCREEKYSSLPTDSGCTSEMYDSATIPQQSSNKLRHGELLEKQSVFDIAYSEAAPAQLRSDSTTPPS